MKKAMWIMLVTSFAAWSACADDMESSNAPGVVTRNVREAASNAFTRISGKVKSLPNADKRNINKRVSELGIRKSRTVAYQDLLKKSGESVLVLIAEYDEEQKIEVRRDLLSVIGKMDKGKYFDDVLAFVEGECLSTNVATQVSAIHAVAQIVRDERHRRRAVSVGSRDDRIKSALSLLVKIANDGTFPYSRAQKEAAEHLYDMGESGRIPKEIRDILQAGPQK